MLHNDLSSDQAPLICFSFERIICERVYKPLLSGYKFQLNWQNVNAINKLWQKEFRILYVTFTWPDKKLDKLEEELDAEGCLYGGVLKVKNNESLHYFLRRNSAFYYDVDKELLDNLYPHGYLWKGYLVSLWNKE